MDSYQIELTDSDISGVLDLFDSEDAPISLSKIGTDTADLTKRGGVYTTEFTIPATKANNKVLDHAYYASNKNPLDVDKDLDAIIRVNGIDIQKGFMRLREINVTPSGREYRFNFFGENTDWSYQLRNKFLTDISWDNDSITYDSSTISNSWSNTFSDEWVFSLINRGQRVKPKETSIQDYLPDYFLNPLIKKSFESVGYKTNSSWLDSGNTKQLMLTFFGKLFKISETVRNNNYVRAYSNDAIFTGESLVLDTTATDGRVVTTLWNDDNVGGTSNWIDNPAPSTDSGNNIAGTTYTAPINAFYQFTTDLYYGGGNFYEQGFPLNGFLPSALKYDFYWLKNGTDKIPVINMQRWKTPSQGAGVQITESTGWVALEAGDTLQFKYEVSWDRSPQYIANIPKFNNTDNAVAELVWVGGGNGNPSEVKVQIGSGVPVGATFSLAFVSDDEIPLIDILNDVARMFNLRFKTNNYTKTVSFEPRDDFLGSASDAIDVSEQLDVSKSYTLRFNSFDWNESIDFTFVDDDAWLKGWENDWETLWAEYTHGFPAKFKDGESSFGTKVLAATHQLKDVWATNTASTQAPYTARIWSKYGGQPPEFNVNHKPRILEYRYQTQSQTAGFIFEGTYYTTIPAATMSKVYVNNTQIINTLNNVRWDTWNGQDGLVANYYGQYLKEIEEGMKLTCHLNLTMEDWINFDFDQLYYFDDRFEDIHGYWILEKIEGFEPTKSKTTKCVFSQWKNYEPVTVSDNVGAGSNDGDSNGSGSGDFTGGGAGGGDTTFTVPNGQMNFGINNSYVLNNGGENVAEAGQSQFVTGIGNTATEFGQQIFGLFTSTGDEIFKIGAGTKEEGYNAFSVNKDGTVSINGSVQPSLAGIVEITTDTTSSKDIHTYLCDASTADITITLDTGEDDIPIPKVWKINKLNAANQVEVVGDDGIGNPVNISGETSQTITSEGDTMQVMWTGTYLIII